MVLMIEDKRLRFIFSQREKNGIEGNRGHARLCVHEGSDQEQVSACVVKGAPQAKTAPMMAAKKPAEPKFTALLRAPLLPPPTGAESGEKVVEGRTEVGMGMGMGLAGIEVLLTGTKEREEVGGRLTDLEEGRQSVANRR